MSDPKLKRTWSIHPILFAAFPALFLYANNLDQVAPGDLWRPLLILLAGAVLLWGVFLLMMRNVIKAGLAASLAILMFFVFSVVLENINKILWATGEILLRNRYFAVICLIVYAYLFWRLYKSRGTFRTTNIILNRVALVLIILQVGAIFMSSPGNAAAGYHTDGIETLPPDTLSQKPSIYYIILDAYAREDILRDYYDYDNSPFLDSLRARGFFIADSSTSNYWSTHMSVSSALNLSYVHGEIEDSTGRQKENRMMGQMIRRNRLARLLKEFDYDFATFSTGYSITEVRNADIYVANPRLLSEFENILMDMTVLPDMLRVLGSDYQHTAHRDRVLYTLDNTGDLAKHEKPVFVLSHVLAPHPPFFANRDGDLVNTQRKWSLMDGQNFTETWGVDEYVSGYRDQVHYLNTRVLSAVDEILVNSDVPPIIIIQGDHGSRSHVHLKDVNETDLKEAFANLCVVYTPKAEGLIPKDITPVNLFRFILNQYFYTDFSILPNECYYPRSENGTELMNVTDKVRPVVAASETDSVAFDR